MNIILALMYHDVIRINDLESGFQNIGAIQYKLNCDDFEHQISEIADYFESKQLNKSQCMLTYDDGGVSFHSVIAPILEKHGFKGYFFITTSLIGTRGFLNSEQILDLHKRGHIIGTHSHTHPKNIADLPYHEIETEWSQSIKILNNILSDKIRMASIPGGFYSEDSKNVLLKNGIEMIFTSIPTKKVILSCGNQHIIGRFCIKKSTKSKTIVDLINNNVLSEVNSFIKWKTARALQNILGNYYYYFIREFLLKHTTIRLLIVVSYVLFVLD